MTTATARPETPATVTAYATRWHSPIVTYRAVMVKCKACKRAERVDAWRITARVVRGMCETVLTLDHVAVRADGRVFSVGDLANGCPFCNARYRSVDVIVGIRNDAVKCDTRCTHAKGHSCECSCGGANHGRSHIGV